jgi:hypothetical protein
VPSKLLIRRVSFFSAASPSAPCVHSFDHYLTP